jgi:hypothetical protein
LFWYGPFPIITIADPELAKQVLSNKLGLYIKPSMRYPIDTLLGKGLVLLNALDWARHRTILNNGFSMDKLKVLLFFFFFFFELSLINLIFSVILEKRKGFIYSAMPCPFFLNSHKLLNIISFHAFCFWTWLVMIGRMAACRPTSGKTGV